MKKRIFFINELLFTIYSFSLSDTHDFKFQWWEYDTDDLYLRKKSLASDSLDLILLSSYNHTTYDDIFIIDKIINSQDILIVDLYSYFNNHNYELTEYISTFKLKFKCVFIDCNGESYSTNNYNQLLIKKLLEYDDSIYIISNRPINIFHSRLLTNNFSTNLLYYYHLLSDNINIHPPIPKLKLVQPEYDFISYISLGSGDHAVDRNWRNDILNKINFLDKSIITPRSFDSLRPIQSEFKKSYGHPQSSFGSYSLFSFIETLNSKIKIVFETENPNEILEDKIYFTEKTLKCLISDQPYFLFLNQKLRNVLEEYGMKFPYPAEVLDIIEYINDICNDNLDEWVSKNSNIFEHNKEVFNKLIYSDKLPHVNQLYTWELL